MNIEVKEKRLYDACLEGDAETLHALMKEDKLTLARVTLSSSFNQTPLHIASMLGHFKFAKSLLSYKPDFAGCVDSQGRSALHLASANGYANIVELLLKYDQKMCQFRDEDGRTPLHLAIMKGQHESVRELIKVSKEPDQERTMLHLCVKHNRLDVLILVLESGDRDLSNFKLDDNGNTTLHCATALQRMQIIQYLVKCRSQVEVNSVNEKGLTALDIIEEMPRDVKSKEIREFLISAGTLRAKEIEAAIATGQLIPGAAATDGSSKLSRMWKAVKYAPIFHEEVEKKDKTVLVAASVIAAMAYTAAISPPGGVASMDAAEFSPSPSQPISPLDGVAEFSDDPYYSSYYLPPGGSLLAYFWPGLNRAFWISNTIAFMAALTVIFLFVSGATLKKRIIVLLIRGGMWVTLTAMTTAYVCAVVATSPESEKSVKNPYTYNKTILAIVLGLFAWMGMIITSIAIAAYPSLRSLVIKITKLKAKRNKINNEDALAIASPSTTHIV